MSIFPIVRRAERPPTARGIAQESRYILILFHKEISPLLKFCVGDVFHTEEHQCRASKIFGKMPGFSALSYAEMKRSIPKNYITF
jgi:hypothetical protein